MPSNVEVVLSFLNHEISKTSVTSSGNKLRLRGEIIAEWKGDDIVVYKSISGKKTNRLRNLLLSLATNKNVNVVEN